MGIFDVKYNFDNLVRMTSAGVEVSSFVQIKNAIIKRYKEIYGNDIDLSDASGDNQLIMMISLLLYNGFNAIYYLNQNIDPASASGKFLDILSGLNNVFRKGATYSTAWLYVKYIGKTSDYISVINPNDVVQKIQCVDTAGHIWTWEEAKGLTGFNTKFNNKQIYALKFTCEDLGAIEAEADDSLKNLTEISDSDLTRDNNGAIYMTIDTNTFPFNVWQAKDAIVGTDEESDESLKKRRLYERGNAGVTVANGMTGSLLNVEGVMEAKLYSNVVRDNSAVTSDEIPANDGTKINFHDLYICLRIKDGITPDSLSIGKILHEKNTPGIVTTPYNTGITPEIEYKLCLENDYGKLKKETISIYNNILKYNVYWKECKPITPSLQLNFMYNPDVFVEDTQKEVIKTAIKNYLFGLTIFDDLNIPNLLSAINQSDVPVNGQNTFFFINGVVETDYTGNEITSPTGTSSYFENKDTYYNYNNEDEVKFDFNLTVPGGASSLYKAGILNIYRIKTTVSIYEYKGSNSNSNPEKDFNWEKLIDISATKISNTITIDLSTIPSYSSYTFYEDMKCSTEVSSSTYTFTSSALNGASAILYAKKNPNSN